MSQEKRKHARISSLNLSYICLDENNKIVKQGMGRTLNVSESGMLLETHLPVDTRHTVKVTIGLEEDMLELQGSPVHSKKNDKNLFEIGIKFQEPDESVKKKLKKFIKAFNKKVG
jgi:hypothetical protein